MGVPTGVNEATLRLFSVVAFDAACTTRDETARDLVEIENNLLLEYQVVIKPEASYAARQIDAHVRRTMRRAEETSPTSHRRWVDSLSRTGAELMREQLIQHMSTRGPLHAGPVCIPVTAVDLHASDEEWKITTFGTLEQDELKEKCLSLISEGTALLHQSVQDCIEILDWTKAEFDISQVRNEEARTLLAARHVKDGTIVRECEEVPDDTSDVDADECSETEEDPGTSLEVLHGLASAMRALSERIARDRRQAQERQAQEGGD